MYSPISDIVFHPSAAELTETAHRRPPPDPTSGQATFAVIAAATVGALIGIAVEADMNWVDRASHGSAEFAGLGEGLMSLAIGVPLTLLVTGLVFLRLPIRSRVAAGAFALFSGINLWQVLFDFGVTSHSSHAGWPAVPLAFGFGLATWIFLPRRSTFVGVAAVLAVLVLLVLGPMVQSSRMDAQSERRIATSGVPIATTSVPGYHLWAAHGSTRYDPTDTSKLDLAFVQDGTHVSTGDFAFRVQTYERLPGFDPPTECAWSPTADAYRPAEPVHCTKVAPRVWWVADSSTVVTEYRGAVVTVTNFGLQQLPRPVLVDAARHLHPTTAHHLVHSANSK